MNEDGESYSENSIEEENKDDNHKRTRGSELKDDNDDGPCSPSQHQQREKRMKSYPKRESSSKFIRQTFYNTPKNNKSKQYLAKRKGDEKVIDKKEKKYT